MECKRERVGDYFVNCDPYRYRYGLWRIWDETKRPALFCMLNPSMANKDENDPTVSRCHERAKNLKLGGVEIVNIFALQSPKPRDLYIAKDRNIDPIGPENDKWILEAAERAGIIICAWGNHGHFLNRALQVMSLLKGQGHKLYALKLNKTGSPRHPLYLKREAKCFPFD